MYNRAQVRLKVEQGTGREKSSNIFTKEKNIIFQNKEITSNTSMSFQQTPKTEPQHKNVLQ